MKNKNNKQKGFTIIELMIAISIFLIVVTIGIGALLNANLLHQKSQDMRSILDSLSFVMEDMSNNLRTGSEYRCFTGSIDLGAASESDCSSGGWAIAFKPQSYDPDISPNQWGYFINNEKIFRSINMDDPNSSLQLTPDEVVIDVGKSNFVVTGNELADNKQPFVTIHLNGNITFKGVITPFNLQTSVSQRLIDL